MTPEDAIVARLKTLSAVTAITGQRWWAHILPQSPTFPAGRVQVIDDPASYHLRGPEGLRRARLQVDAYVDNVFTPGRYAVMTALVAAIEGDGKGDQATGLSGWIGSIGSPAFIVSGCFQLDRTVRYDPEELRLLTTSLDYYVWWKQTT